MIRLIEPSEAHTASCAEAFDSCQGFPRRAGNPFSAPHGA